MRIWGYIIALLVADVVALIAWFFTALAENCDGADDWTCSDFIADVSPFAFVFGTLALITLLIVALGGARRS